MKFGFSLFLFGCFLSLPALAVHKKYDEQRRCDYDVKFYKLDIEANDSNTYVAGNTTILSKVTSSKLDTFKFDLYSGIAIDSVYQQNRKIAFIRQGDVAEAILPVPALLGELLSVTIYHRGTVPSNGFFTPVASKVEGKWKTSVTWSLSEPFGAKYWFPCKEFLPDKADSAWIFITVPNRLKAGSNGMLTATVPVGQNKTRYEWKTRYPIAFYLISFTVANYQEYNFYARLSNQDSVLVQNLIYNRPNYLAENKRDIDKTAAFLQYYSSIYGMYPFVKEKYGHCTAPLSGGMENQTMTTLSDFDSMLVAHELAHQWFGDHVTCAAWQDIWLNEGFASYSEYLALDRLYSHNAAISWMKEAHQSALREASGQVCVPTDGLDNELRIFNSNLTYKKGASMIHQLRYELNNDSLFFGIIRQYLSEFKDSTATTRDFVKIVNRMSKQDYGWFFDQWYYGTGYPRMDVAWKQKKDSVLVVMSQSSSSGKMPVFKMHFDLQLVYKNGTTALVRLWQDKDMMRFSIPANGEIKTIRLDPEEWLLKQTSIDKVRELPTLSNPINIEPTTFTSMIEIQFSGIVKSAKIKLEDMNGTVYLNEKVKDKASQKIDTSHLLAGSYLLYVKISGKTYIRKVTKN
jgi:aminopeptidase N